MVDEVGANLAWVGNILVGDGADDSARRLANVGGGHHGAKGVRDVAHQRCVERAGDRQQLSLVTQFGESLGHTRYGVEIARDDRLLWRVVVGDVGFAVDFADCLFGELGGRRAGEHSTPTVAVDVENITAELHELRLLCPTYGPTYYMAGQMEKFVLGLDRGDDHIRRAYKLSPCDAAICFTAGSLDISDGRVLESVEKFKRYIKVGGRFRDAADIYIKQLNRPDLAVLIAADNAYNLNYVVHALISLEKKKDLSEVNREILSNALASAITLLETKCQKPDISASSLATLGYAYRQGNNVDLAIKYFRQAVDVQYDQTNWRLILARLLAETNEVGQAVHQARICLRLSPEMSGAKKLLAELNLLQ